MSPSLFALSPLSHLVFQRAIAVFVVSRAVVTAQFLVAADEHAVVALFLVAAAHFEKCFFDDLKSMQESCCRKNYSRTARSSSLPAVRL